jgi:hypothetical protein
MSNQKAAAAAHVARVDETPLARFERELQERNPNREITRFDFPSKIKEARAVYIKEISSKDALEAAKYADATASDIEKKSVKLMADAERKEHLRISIVGVVTRKEPLEYRHIGGAHPFHEIDTWSDKAMTCLLLYYNQVNGIPTDEVLEGLKGARIIGASAPPTSATPASAATES